MIGASLQGRGCKSGAGPVSPFWVMNTISWQPKPSPQFSWEVVHEKGCSDAFLMVSITPEWQFKALAPEMGGTNPSELSLQVYPLPGRVSYSPGRARVMPRRASSRAGLMVRVVGMLAPALSPRKQHFYILSQPR